MFIILFPILILSLPQFVSSSSCPISQSHNCPIPYSSSLSPCLHTLSTNPSLYSGCKSRTCFLFIEGAPFVILPETQSSSEQFKFQSQIPFNCSDYIKQGLQGFAFEIMSKTSAGNDLCIWAGDAATCTYNELVDFTIRSASDDYKFAITGILLETPCRQCNATAGASLLDDQMILIGKATHSSSSDPPVWSQLIKPFHYGAWMVIILMIIFFIIVCILIANRFPFPRRNSLLNAFLVFIGEDRSLWSSQCEYQTKIEGDQLQTAELHSQLLTKYSIVKILYGMAVSGLIITFLLYVFHIASF